MLMFLAGLQNVPEELDEARVHRRRLGLAAVPPHHAAAAQADAVPGADARADRHLAGLRPGLRDEPGGPEKTTLTPAYLIYREGFQNSAMGRAAAIAFIVLVIILVFTGVQRLVLRKER